MNVPRRGSSLAWGPYRVPHLRVVGRSYFTNKVPAGAFRSLGRAQTTWGYESHYDTIACKLGIDPVAFRQRNFLQRGERLIETVGPFDTDMDDLVRRALAALDWNGRLQRVGPHADSRLYRHHPGARSGDCGDLSPWLLRHQRLRRGGHGGQPWHHPYPAHGGRDWAGSLYHAGPRCLADAGRPREPDRGDPPAHRFTLLGWHRQFQRHGVHGHGHPAGLRRSQAAAGAGRRQGHRRDTRRVAIGGRTAVAQ